jgi:DNA-directed RNA polymerase subunit RPC12/RpoP
VLDALTHIAYREATDAGFTIPGICRADIITRKPRRVKNPQTGEIILIAEHDTLRVRALKAARNAVTPQPDNLITVLPQAPAPAAFEDYSEAFSFRCKKCAQEIEAPRAAIGIQAQCPACGELITVPAESEPGTDTPPPAPAPRPDAAPSGQKNRGGQTIRLDLVALGFTPSDEPAAARPPPAKRMLSFFCKNCRQEIEAPADMAGTASECPSCGVSLEVPFFSDPGTLHGSDLDSKKAEESALKDARSRTIRIEIPDDL